MFYLFSRILVLVDAIATSNAKCEQRVSPCPRIGKASKCLRFHRLVVACSMRQLPKGGSAMSAGASESFRLRLFWRIILIISSLRKTFVKPTESLLFANLMFWFSLFCCLVRVAVVDLAGLWKRGFVVWVLAACFFCCQVAYYFVLTMSHS